MNYPLFAFFLLFAFCQEKPTPIKELFDLPIALDESSSVEITAKSPIIWSSQDSGNDAVLFGLDENGTIVRTISIANVSNHDWEDLTSDSDGNIYIGDFGNNKNARQDLSIYKIDSTDLDKKTANATQITTFYYPEQNDFPPKKAERIFDSEAFFLFKDNFYIVIKNRSSNFDGTANLYRVPNKPGNYAAKLIGSFKTGNDFRHFAITSADISPDGSKVALLSSSHVWIFENFTGDDFFSGKITQIDLDHYSQKEGICFKSNSKLYITDEKDKKSGGKLYELKIP